MKFTYAWSDIASQNVTLKISVVCLSICIIVLGIATIKLGLKGSIVVERGCYSKALSQGSSERTAADIETFVKEFLPQRFDSNAQMTRGAFDVTEESARNQEQKDFSSRSMTQRVVVNSVKITNGQAIVDADRVISVGQIRSAFPFPLIVSVANDARTEINPYGLMITKITQPKEEDRNAKK